MNKAMTRSLVACLLGLLAAWAAAGAVVAAALSGPGTSIIVAATPGDSKDPDVAYTNGVTHVVWSEAGWIMHSKNTGLSWTAPISVATGDDPSLAVGAGVLHLAFTETSSPTINVYTTRYVSNTWTPPLQVSGGANNTSEPDIAAAPNGDLYTVWSEQVGGLSPIEIAKSTDGGVTWPSVAPISNVAGNAPRIAIGPDGVQRIVWQDAASAPFRIKYAERTTTTWSIPALLSDASASSFVPEIAAQTGKAHAVWQQSSSVRYAHGAGLLWSSPITLSTSSASEPAIAASSFGALIAAWDEGTTIAVRMGGAGGWGVTQTLGTNVSGIGHVALASGVNGTVHAAFTSGASGSRDIAYNSFTTNGVFLPLVTKN